MNGFPHSLLVADYAIVAGFFVVMLGVGVYFVIRGIRY